MDNPVAGHDPQMPLPRIDPAQHHGARLCFRRLLQPRAQRRRLELIQSTARQPVSAGRRDPHPGAFERDADQPDAIDPVRRISPMQSKPRADQHACRRQDDARRPDHPPG